MTECCTDNRHKLEKSERACSKITIDRLFKGGQSRSMTAYPLRVVYLIADSQDKAQCQFMVSVPKKCFRRAVKRNRVKRQVRETYRTNKHIVAQEMARHEGKGITMAFIWLDANLHATSEIEGKMKGLLQRISEKICENS